MASNLLTLMRGLFLIAICSACSPGQLRPCGGGVLACAWRSSILVSSTRFRLAATGALGSSDTAAGDCAMRRHGDK